MSRTPPSADAERLLVVDDNEMNRDVLSRQLRRRGYEVDVATDGVHALELCSGTRYALILLDIMMPRMNGIDVVRELRQSHARAELPIIMVTAKSDSADVVEALNLGANDYIVKPFSFAIVAARVEAALRMSVEARRPTSGLFGEERKSTLQRATRACAFCGSALLDDPDTCSHCERERPGSGWPPVSPADSPHFARVIGGRYFLERFITQGSSGEVFRCRDLDLGRIFAAKIIDVSGDTRTDEETLRERIRVEVQALVHIRSPHVVKIYEVIRLAPKIYALIMDYVRGESLGAVLASGQVFEPQVALALVRQVALGLLEAHDASMIHRDVKPDNIMVERLPSGDLFAQLLDFGIVSRLGETVTTEHFYGTPLYASPEQSVYHRPVDHRADIYSLGVVLYHMLAGVPPFLGDSVEEILAEHATAPIPRLAGGDGLLTPALDELLARMMTKDADARFASMQDVIGHIDELSPLLDYRDVLPSEPAPLSATVEVESDLERRMAERRPVPTLAMDRSADAAAASHTRLRYPIRSITEALVTGRQHALVVEQAGQACHVTALDFARGTITKWLVLDNASVRAVALSSCGHFLALADETGPVIRVFGTASRREMRSWSWPVPGVSALSLSHEGRLIAVGTEAGGLALADTWGSNQPVELPSVPRSVSAVRFAPNGATLAVGSDDLTVRLVGVPDGQLLATSAPLVAPPVELAFIGDTGLSVLTSAGHVVTMSVAPLAVVGQTRLTGLASIRYDEEHRVVGLVACDGDWDLVDWAAMGA